MLLSLVSAKGAPGCTAVALTLTAALGRTGDAVAVEADPGGGDLKCWVAAQQAGEPGLVALVAALRAEPDPDEVLGGVRDVVPGVRAVTGPTAATVMQTTLAAGGSRLAAALAATAGWVVADCGRWFPDSPAQRVVQASGLVAIVTRPTLDGVEHSRHLVDTLHGAHELALVLVGDRPYGATEIAAATGAPVLGVMAWDPAGLVELVAAGVSRRWGRSPLARSAAAIADTLTATALVNP